MFENPPLPADHLFWLTMLFFATFLVINVYLSRTIHADRKPSYSHFVDYTPVPGALLVVVLYSLGAEGLAFFTTPIIVVSYACIWHGSFSVLRIKRL